MPALQKIAFAAFALGYYFILFKGGTFDGPLFWPAHLLTHILLISGAILLSVRIFRVKRLRLAGGHFDILLLLLLVYMAVETLISPFPGYSQYSFVMFFLLLCAFYCALQFIESGENLTYFLKIIAFGAILISV